mmetsp:Transcript_24216/g.40041  ORF Transcript_24216/g.40041 Transcript_24216/m.40041 type:complete len:155 (+) Transcript_24216:156-620(+)
MSYGTVKQAIMVRTMLAMCLAACQAFTTTAPNELGTAVECAEGTFNLPGTSLCPETTKHFEEYGPCRDFKDGADRWELSWCQPFCGECHTGFICAGGEKDKRNSGKCTRAGCDPWTTCVEGHAVLDETCVDKQCGPGLDCTFWTCRDYEVFVEG